MKNTLCALLVTLLAGCATAVKVESGERTVGKRLVITLDGPWNQINLPNAGVAQTWTMEGLPIDQLLVYSGVKDNEEIATQPREGAAGRPAKKLAFRSSMQPDEIVGLVEGMLTLGGSTFKLEKLEPAGFGGGKGFRFEYSLIRKVDNVRLSGVGYGTVDSGELFALVYMAPKLTFFPRHRQGVERLAASAKLRRP